MRKHITAEGNNILISDMDDVHLQNTIKMYCNKIKKSYSIVTGEFKNDISSIAAGININSGKEKAKQVIQDTTEYLGDYILEASIRGINMQGTLQETFGRKEKTNLKEMIMGDNLLISSGDYDEDNIPF